MSDRFDRVVYALAGVAFLCAAGGTAAGFFLRHNEFEAWPVWSLAAIASSWLFLLGMAFSLLFGWKSR